MPDLVEKYFKDDLTEAEQQGLSEFLLGSEEAALKFETLAKEAYLRYGHPEPQPRWDDPPSPPSSIGNHWGPWFWTSIFIVGLAVFHHYFQPGRGIFPLKGSISGAQSREALNPLPDQPKVLFKVEKTSLGRTTQKNVPVSTGVDEEKASSSSPEVPSVSGSRVPSDAEMPENQPQRTGLDQVPAWPLNSTASAGSTPVNLDLNSSKTYSNLSVVVSQSQLGSISVRITDTSGVEIKRLYLGNLGPGNWAFEWDGKLSNGLAANPGYYQIEVKSGSSTQRKSIQIQ
jgi:hypothetical protein